jgi:uncharacterized membrane protein
VITGGSTSYTVSVSGTNGFNGSVNLSLSGLPAGASGSFSGPASPGSSSTLSVSSGTAAAGTYSFTITGTFGSLSHQTSATLVVQPQGDFTLSTSPTSTSIRRGNSTSYAIAINRVGNFADPVSFSVGGLPSGASASFNPASTTGTSSTLSIGTSFRAQRGSFYLTITGTAAGGVTRTAQVTLSIR